MAGLIDHPAVNILYGENDQRRLGIVAGNLNAANQIKQHLEGLGATPQQSILLESLDRNPVLLGGMDAVVAHFPTDDELCERCAGIIRTRLSEDATFSAVVLVPLELVEVAWRFFSGLDAQILVDPDHGEILAGIAGLISSRSRPIVRETDSDSQRLLLNEVLAKLSGVEHALNALGPLFFKENLRTGSAALNDPGKDFKGPAPEESRLIRAARPSLPDSRLVRRIIRQRQLRARFFDGDLFADPAWDMLLDLTAARAEHARVSVTSLCIASGVPPTTALRWIGQMTIAGLLERVEDDADRRRAFVTLTDKAAEAMARYFAELGNNAGRLV